MNKSVQVPPEAEIQWSRVLGYFIWSMGQLEWQCYEWGLRLGGDTLKDKLIDKIGFGGRHELLMKAIQSSPWPAEKKAVSALKWRKALGFSRFRNIVAHNPVIMNQNYPGFFGIVNARALKGSHDRYHRIYFAPIVYSTAQKMKELNRSLSLTLNSE